MLKWQCLYQLDSDKFKISLRSKKYVDVSEIAVMFGGGGHVRVQVLIWTEM
ncbi:MAG: DHH family phosphoesterase [Eubacterium sp.]